MTFRHNFIRQILKLSKIKRESYGHGVLFSFFFLSWISYLRTYMMGESVLVKEEQADIRDTDP
jgi:hypothetical protein